MTHALNSRRSILAGMAVCAAGATTAGAAAAAPANPDAELIRLGEEFRAASAAVDTAIPTMDGWEEVYFSMAPEFPAAALKTDRDRALMLCWEVVGHYEVQDIPHLRSPQMGEAYEPIPGRLGEFIVRPQPWPEKQARATEIADALEGYEAAKVAAREKSGLAAAEAEFDALHDKLREIEDRILHTPAHTLAGVMVKARVVEWCYVGDIQIDPDAVTAYRFSTMLAIDLLRVAGTEHA
jgi:hypothetical protein